MEIETLQINESGMKLLQMEKTRNELCHVVKFTYPISGVNVLNLSNDQSQKQDIQASVRACRYRIPNLETPAFETRKIRISSILSRLAFSSPSN